MNARSRVLAATIFIHQCRPPSNADVEAAYAEVAASGALVIDDLIILAFAEYYGVFDPADAAIIGANAATLLAPTLASRPNADDQELRKWLRRPSQGTGQHRATDAVDGRLILVLELLAQRAPSIIGHLAPLSDPSRVLERWAMSAWIKNPRATRIVAAALLSRPAEVSAFSAGSILARAGAAYVRREPTNLPLFIPRGVSATACVLALSVVATHATSLQGVPNAQHRFSRYVTTIGTIARQLLTCADAVTQLCDSVEDHFALFIGNFALRTASGTGLRRAQVVAGNTLSKVFARRETLADHELIINAWDMNWAMLLVEHLPLTKARFLRLVENLQCDRLTHTISRHEYFEERARLIKLTALALTVQDASLRSIAMSTCGRLNLLPVGYKEIELGEVANKLEATALAALPRM